MASKARELAELIGNAGGTSEQVLSGRRNLIINGAMQVAQRGTSGTGNNVYSLDRWYVNGSGTTVSYSQESLTAGELQGFTHALKLTGVSTDSSRQIYQKIEGLKQFSGQTVTMSFYAKADASFTTNVQYGLLGSGNDSYTNTPDIEVGTSWEHYSVTFTIPDLSSGYTFGSGSNLRICFNLKEPNYVVYFTGMQLELGSVATPFEHRSYGEELALCQRYYQKYTRRGAIYAPISSNSNYNTWFGTFSVPMRTAPTFVELAGDSWTYYGDTNSFEFYRFPVGNYLPPAWSADAEL